MWYQSGLLKLVRLGEVEVTNSIYILPHFQNLLLIDIN